MFIGHLPAGYIVSKATRLSGPLALAYLIGSVAPDIDMLWFFLVDGQQTHHHHFITHRPVVWACIALAGLIFRQSRFGPWAIGLGLGGLLHVALDSIVGQVAWFWPFSDAAAPLVVVPATHDWWMMSFLTHWTFAVEIALVLIALILLAAGRYARK